MSIRLSLVPPSDTSDPSEEAWPTWLKVVTIHSRGLDMIAAVGDGAQLYLRPDFRGSFKIADLTPDPS